MVFCANMDMSEHTGLCSSTVLTDDLSITQVIKMDPATRAADSSHTAECDGRDCLAEGKPDSLPNVKEEPEDVNPTVLYCLYICIV